MKWIGLVIGFATGFVIVRMSRPKKRKSVFVFRPEQVVPSGHVSLDRVTAGAPVGRDFTFTINETP